jgi:hypothetical protein
MEKIVMERQVPIWERKSEEDKQLDIDTDRLAQFGGRVIKLSELASLDGLMTSDAEGEMLQALIYRNTIK